MGHVNRVAVMSRDKTDVSRRGRVNDTDKKTADSLTDILNKKASIRWQDSARRQFQAGGTYRQRRTLIGAYLESPFPTACLL